MNCDICNDEGWVCENHPDIAWGEGRGCCGGAGMPCACNKTSPPWAFMGQSTSAIEQQFGKISCPKCGSGIVATERRPDGDNVCVECSHRWKNK